MTAWTALLAASSLTSGSAWQLLNNPKTGSGLVINDGVYAELSNMTIDVEVLDDAVLSEVLDEPVVVEVSTTSIEVEIAE